jgi:2-isopropylmalate synthase
MVEELIKAAVEKCEKVELVCMDATRADRQFLKDVSVAAYNNGAVAVTLCDDAGVMMPEEFAEMVADVKSVCGAKLYVMPSDAINMAAANAVAALKAGADGVETAVYGNWLSAEILSDIIRVKGADIGIEGQLNATDIHRETEEIKAMINGKNGAVTVSTDGVRSSVSLNAESTLSDVCEAVRALGYELSHEDSGKVYDEFKRVALKKSKIGIKEIDAIVAAAAMQVPSTYHVESYVINSGNIISATANITLIRDGEKLCGISTGDGPINAAFLAIEQIIGHHYELDDFQIQSVTEGHEAMGSALVKLRDGDKLYSGSGVSTDIIGASIRAYINALNKIVYGAK